jgi:4-hydroxybenzoate polyprenyltransferase
MSFLGVVIWFSSIIAVLALWWFGVSVFSAVGLLAICLLIMIATLAASAHLTFEKMKSQSATDVVTKSGTISGALLMNGSSGVLLFLQDQRIFHFEKMDEIKSIEWRRSR